MATIVEAPVVRAPEAESGLDPWREAELPPPPMPRGIQWFGVVGPGVIVLGVAIGSGEFLLGPAAFLQYGLVLLWVTLAAVFLQTVFNTELMRYTLATGEPAFTGFMRTRPSSTFWAWFYSILYFLQAGWPAWAANAAAAIYFLWARQLPGAEAAGVVTAIGIGTFLLCVAVLLVGRRIERTLELLNWVMVVAILGGLGALALLFVAPETWLRALAGFFAFDLQTNEFRFIPEGADLFLLGAFAAYSGCGGVFNLTLSNWARDKGYGMSKLVGYIPAAVGGTEVKLAHSGFRFAPTPEAMVRWKGWWRIVRADQWGVFFVGALLGMVFPALLYITFLPAGTDIRGLGMAAALADSVGSEAGALAAGAIAFLGAWILLKAQLDILDGMTRSLTDMLWTGSKRLRAMPRADVRKLYYGVLAVVVVWGMIAMQLAQPAALLQLGANMAGVVFVISSLHLLYVNTRLLPVELRPPLWRRAALVATSVFYGAFVFFWLTSLVFGG